MLFNHVAPLVSDKQHAVFDATKTASKTHMIFRDVSVSASKAKSREGAANKHHPSIRLLRDEQAVHARWWRRTRSCSTPSSTKTSACWSGRRLLEENDADNVSVMVDRDDVLNQFFHCVQNYSPRQFLRGSFHVTFHNEPGMDAGGLTREWLLLLTRSIFKPAYALFSLTAPTFPPSTPPS